MESQLVEFDAFPRQPGDYRLPDLQVSSRYRRARSSLSPESEPIILTLNSSAPDPLQTSGFSVRETLRLEGYSIGGSRRKDAKKRTSRRPRFYSATACAARATTSGGVA